LSGLADTIEHMFDTTAGGLDLLCPDDPYADPYADPYDPGAPPWWLDDDRVLVAGSVPGLADLPVAELGDDAALRALAELERLKARVDAQQLRVLARFAELRPGRDREFAGDEVAVELRLTCAAAGHRMDLAETLTARLPATFAALQRGEIDLGRARVLAELTRPLSDGDARRVEERVLPRAPEQNSSQLRQSTRRAVIKVDPEGAERRHRRCLADRRVGVAPREDGMADLSIFGAAHDIAAAFEHIDRLARMSRGGGDERTLDQIRADTALDLLMGRCAAAPAPGRNATVQVVVPISALLGLDEEPGELAGYGPIPASMAREIAAEGTWRRMLTDPASGALLDFGRKTYRPPAALADHVRARDKTCVFPGCRRPARRCDLDHSKRSPDGPTAADNMAPLCRRHHRAKTHGRWSLVQEAPGRFRWTTPAGRTFIREPEPMLEPDPPPEPPKADDDQPPF